MSISPHTSHIVLFDHKWENFKTFLSYLSTHPVSISPLSLMHPFILSVSLQVIPTQFSRSFLIHPTNTPKGQQSVSRELVPFLAIIYQACHLTTLGSNPEPRECSQVLYSNSTGPHAQFASVSCCMVSSHFSRSSSSFQKT